jgi:predicted phosphodiesterase
MRRGWCSTALAFLVVCLLAFGVAAAWPNKGPYLIYEGNPDEMVVLWQTRTTQTCSIEWGTDDTCADGSMRCDEVGEDHQYRVTLTDLDPDTVYHYCIVFGDDDVQSRFRTAPRQEADEVRFLAWTDTQDVDSIYSSMASSIRQEMQADPTLQTLVLHGGDWVGFTAEEMWAQFFRKTSARYVLAQVPMQGCIGNHDVGYARIGGDTFAKYWSYPFVDDHYWSFDYGPVHFVILDLYTAAFLAEGTDKEQLEWLAEDLRSHDRPWTVAVFHNPLCEEGSIDCEEAYNALYPTLHGGNVDVLYTGHWHKYYAMDFDGMIQVVGGAAGTAGVNVYAVFDVTSERIRIDTKWSNGEIMDSVEIEQDSSS